MTEELSHDQLLRILELAYLCDCHDTLWWKVVDGRITVYVNCSDLFAWATADIEEITPIDLPLLEEAYEIVKHSQTDKIWLGEMYAVKKRKLVPQAPFLKLVDDEKVLQAFTHITK